MIRQVRRPRIGQWYARRDTRELFQVTGVDEHSRTVEVQTLDGNLDEIELKEWRVIPVTLTVPPEDWTGAVDISSDDLDYPSCDGGRPDSSGTMEDPFGEARENWEDTDAEEEIDVHTERMNPQDLM